MSVVRLENIVKQYPRVKALDKANFTLAQGEIHALLGENGAGKSTLMKVLYGMTRPDAGQIWVQGREVTIHSPLEAISYGIGMVHQHFMLADAITVLDNIIAGAEPGCHGRIGYKEAAARVEQMIDQAGFRVDASKRVEELSVGEKQRVEILKVLYRGADILILDEPTAVLTPLEVDGLFSVLRRLKEEGKSIIIITHKLYEATEIADRITVMRDGKVTGEADPATTTPFELATLMVGREIKLGQRARAEKTGASRFAVRGLTLKEKGRTVLEDIRLEIRAGEILGIAGVEGNGQSELIRALTGMAPVSGMEVTLDGAPIRGNATAFIEAGVGHIPEDRLLAGVVTDLSIGENIMLGYHRQAQFLTRGLYDKSKIRSYAEDAIAKFRIKAPGGDTLLKELSGGNQQKVVVARVLGQAPKVVICAQPTRGVDVGAIEYIHEKIREYRDAGNAVLLISADLQEVQSLSDTIAVIYRGKIVSTGATDDYTDVALGILMTGGNQAEGEADKL